MIDFAVPHEIEQRCDNVRTFMDDHINPLERTFELRWEIGGPAYLVPIRAVQAKAKQAGYWGAAGLTEDHPLALFYRPARAAHFYDGPDEVHKMVVARRILSQYEGKRSTR